MHYNTTEKNYSNFIGKFIDIYQVLGQNSKAKKMSNILHIIIITYNCMIKA